LLRTLEIDDPLAVLTEPGRAPPIALPGCFLAATVADSVDAALDEAVSSQGWANVRVRVCVFVCLVLVVLMDVELGRGST
jgi:hypothetical protein